MKLQDNNFPSYFQRLDREEMHITSIDQGAVADVDPDYKSELYQYLTHCLGE